MTSGCSPPYRGYCYPMFGDGEQAPCGLAGVDSASLPTVWTIHDCGTWQTPQTRSRPKPRNHPCPPRDLPALPSELHLSSSLVVPLYPLQSGLPRASRPEPGARGQRRTSGPGGEEPGPHSRWLHGAALDVAAILQRLGLGGHHDFNRLAIAHHPCLGLDLAAAYSDSRGRPQPWTASVWKS